ncbi:MAG: hypothetical protein RSC43_00835 [Clostridia bacterium]
MKIKKLEITGSGHFLLFATICLMMLAGGISSVWEPHSITPKQFIKAVQAEGLQVVSAMELIEPGPYKNVLMAWSLEEPETETMRMYHYECDTIEDADRLYGTFRDLVAESEKEPVQQSVVNRGYTDIWKTTYKDRYVLAYHKRNRVIYANVPVSYADRIHRIEDALKF